MSSQYIRKPQSRNYDKDHVQVIRTVNEAVLIPIKGTDAEKDSKLPRTIERKVISKKKNITRKIKGKEVVQEVSTLHLEKEITFRERVAKEVGKYDRVHVKWKYKTTSIQHYKY